MSNTYNVDPTRWYSPNDIVKEGLLFGKSKRYVFGLIQKNKIKATNTSDTQKPQWKILGKDLIDFIRGVENESSNVTN